jgi:hypothetical protein
MQSPLSTTGRVAVWPAGLALLALSVSPYRAIALSPKSPEVQRAVARAVGYLESDAASDPRPGGKALIGLALLKNGAGAKDPKVVDAVGAIRKVLGDGDPKAVHFDEMYSPALATIFLITLDPSEYASEIQCLLDYLQLQQKPHGGWGYPQFETGDTSMTQHVVLCSWEAIHAGFHVPWGSIEKVATWLLKTQDPSGAYGYQGNVSDSFTPIKQGPIRPSLSAAGLGSVYICANLLGVAAEREVRHDGLPPALKEVDSGRDRRRDRLGAKTQLDPRLFLEAQARGNRWMAANYVINAPEWTHYYLFALERYWSFREAAEVRTSTRKPADNSKWYDDGVRFLLKTQAENGSWQGQEGLPINTAFAVLFLIRSTQKSIEKVRSFGDGTLVGGRGLPKQTSRVEVRSGKVVAQPMDQRVEQVLAVLENRENPDYQQAIEALGELPAQQLEALMGGQAERLRRLAGDESAEARRAAVRALAKTHSLDNVPTLIYALSDTDAEVAREARDALRRISRKPFGFGLADPRTNLRSAPGTPPTEADRREAIEKWKAWYRAVRPDAEFDN